MKGPENIIISRTDSIGDVVLTLPMAKALKEAFPGIRIGFMGKAYTKAVIESCEYVDEFIDVHRFMHEEITVCGLSPKAIIHVFPVPAIAKRAKQLHIPLRVGTTNRLYHWFTCNKLIKLSRRKSNLHEAQLNLKLLKALGIKSDYSLTDIAGMYGLHKTEPLKEPFSSWIDKSRYNLILHPKSQGNGREWGLDNFIELIRLLPPGQFKLFVSGTDKERTLLQPLFDAVGNSVTDVCGKMTLDQFISFINACDGLVASGTGPLHLAAALGKYAFGLFPPDKPIHPERWAPVGKKAQFFVSCVGDELKKEDATFIPISPTIVKEGIERGFILVL